MKIASGLSFNYLADDCECSRGFEVVVESGSFFQWIKKMQIL